MDNTLSNNLSWLEAIARLKSGYACFESSLVSTAELVEGCGIFWRRSKFELLASEAR